MSPYPEITARVRQVQSCPANKNPCHPATGDKSRAETDFHFAGRPFTRHYHSIGEQANAGFGEGWTHTFSQRVNRSPNVFNWISPEGYYHGVVHVSGEISRLADKADHRIEKLSGIGWRLTLPSGETQEFDTQGRLTAIRNPASPQSDVTLSYNAIGLQQVIDSTGRVLQFQYEDGLIARIVLPDGEAVEYEYDTSHNLVGVGYGDGQVKQYHYAEAGLAEPLFKHHLTGISEDEVRYASFGYDAYGRVTSSRLHGANGFVESTTLSYTSATQVQVSTPLGETQTYMMQAGMYRRPLSIAGGNGSSGTTYDPEGRIATRTDTKGVVTTYDYPSLTTRSVTGAFGTPHQQRTETDIQSVWNIPTERRTYNAANALVAKTTWTHNPRGQVLTQTQTEPATGATRTSTTTYCEAADVSVPNSTCPRLGLVKSIDGPRTDVSDLTTFAYYPSDDASCATEPTTCPHRKGDLWKVTNALGHVTETLRYDGAGRVLRTKDANGVVTDLAYHPRGWLTARKVRGADNGSETDDAVTRIDYFPTGLVQRVTQPDGDFLEYEYDAAHRLTAIEDALGHRIDYTLDAAGNRTAELTKDAAGEVTRQLSRVFDQLGRLDQEKNAAQQVIADHGYDANGNLTSTIDALGYRTEQSYDPLNRLKQTIQDAGGLDVQTDYHYDALDRLTRVTDPKGLHTDYGYDGLGDLRTLTSPDTGVAQYTPDAAGNRIAQTDARNVATTLSYDALNRLETTRYPGDPSLDVTYVYDSVNPICAPSESFAVGRLTRMSDASGQTEYCYNRFGHLVAKVQTTNGQTLTTRYATTPGGRLATLTYPSGTQAHYARNALGQITGVNVRPMSGFSSSTPAVVIQNAAYLPFGPLTRLHYGNDRSQERRYDADYGIDAITGAMNADVSLDAAGNPIDVSDGDHGNRYRYDPLHRLEGVATLANTPVEAYTYDATGNRLSKTRGTNAAQVYTYPPTSHRLSGIGGTARSYDANGNTTQRGDGNTFVYNAANRLSAVQGTQGVIEYRHNGRGERVAKQSAVLKENRLYSYGDNGQLLSESELYNAPCICLPGRPKPPPQARAHTDYIWLDDLPVAAVRNGVVYYIESDHLGTPRAVIDPNNKRPIWTWSLIDNPFGEAAPNQGADRDGTAFVFDLRYPGQYFDSETGLHYNYFRDYEKEIGRYIESDPIGLNGGLSTYGYAGANPLKATDPRGLSVHGWAAFSGCLAGCVGDMLSNFAKCAVPVLKHTGDLNQCNTLCKPKACEAANQCARGCLSGGAVSLLSSTMLGRSMTSSYGVILGFGGGAVGASVFKPAFSFDLCPLLYGLGPEGAPPSPSTGSSP